METQKNDEKNIVLELKRQLGRMMVQVDYMYRNDREMSRLDLDILMEHTRDLYDLLCDFQAEKLNNHIDESLKSEEEQPIVEKEINEGGEVIKHDVELEIETPEEVLKEPEINDENDEEDFNLIEQENKIEEEKQVEEEIEEKKEEPHEVTKHVLEVDEDDLDEEDDWEDEGDEMFRVEPMEDNSLVAKLQRAHVSDIRLAMGINDKVMMVNDLFGGSVERYNKSIDALNDFPTLSGAKVYMSELQIELQWDTESQAYKMLNDLVERRFV